MNSEFRFLCINDYNSGTAVSIPYEISNTANAFIIAQHVLNRDNGFLYFSEALDYVSRDSDSELFGMPFGYDGSYRTAYIHKAYVVVRREWNPIYLKDLKFIPFKYLKIDGKPTLNEDFLFNYNDLKKDTIRDIMHEASQKMLEDAGGFDAYYADGFERYNFEENKERLNNLFDNNKIFTVDDVTIEHDLTINSFDELIEIFPEYAEYATSFKDVKIGYY